MQNVYWEETERRDGTIAAKAATAVAKRVCYNVFVWVIVYVRESVRVNIFLDDTNKTDMDGCTFCKQKYTNEKLERIHTLETHLCLNRHIAYNKKKTRFPSYTRTRSHTLTNIHFLTPKPIYYTSSTGDSTYYILHTYIQIPGIQTIYNAHYDFKFCYFQPLQEDSLWILPQHCFFCLLFSECLCVCVYVRLFCIPIPPIFGVADAIAHNIQI